MGEEGEREEEEEEEEDESDICEGEIDKESTGSDACSCVTANSRIIEEITLFKRDSFPPKFRQIP